MVDTQRGVIDVEAIPAGQTVPSWWAFDLLTGESQVEKERSADDLAVAAMAGDAQPDVDFDLTDTPGEAILRRVNADGEVLWRRDDLYGSSMEGFRTSSSQTDGPHDVTVVFGCVGQPIDPYATNMDELCQ